MADLHQSLRDAAYIGIGFGVIGFQKAQVLRHDLTKQVKQRLETTELDLRVDGLGDKLQPVLDRLEDLPTHALNIAGQAAGRAREAGQQLSGRIKAHA